MGSGPAAAGCQRWLVTWQYLACVWGAWRVLGGVSLARFKGRRWRWCYRLEGHCISSRVLPGVLTSVDDFLDVSWVGSRAFTWGGLTILVYCVGLSTVIMGSLSSGHLVWFRLLCFRVYVGGRGCVVCFFLATDAWETRSRVMVAVQGAPLFRFGRVGVVFFFDNARTLFYLSRFGYKS